MAEYLHGDRILQRDTAKIQVQGVSCVAHVLGYADCPGASDDYRERAYGHSAAHRLEWHALRHHIPARPRPLRNSNRAMQNRANTSSLVNFDCSAGSHERRDRHT